MRCHFAGHRGRRVEGVGPLSAPVILLGEAPGKDEERDGEPFLGTAGKFLWTGRDFSGQTAWAGLESMGLRRRDVRIENVVETRPQDNALWRMTPPQIEEWQRDLLERRMPKWGGHLVVPMGNLALNTLRRAPLPLTQAGKWRMRSTPQGPQIDWRDKIGNWRGSIFYSRAENGQRIKTIPLYHPSFVMRGGDNFEVWQADWDRVLGDMAFSELRRYPKSEHMIDPTARDVHMFRMLVNQTFQKEGRDAILASDIETLAGGKVIDCIGFSVDPEFTITFDLLHRKELWQEMRALLAHPIAKCWHFGLYDLFQLWRKGVKVENSRWDTHQLHHMLNPLDEHNLGYCASRDLRVRYWKDERKEEGKAHVTRVVRDFPKRHRYNGKDTGNTRALASIYIAQARARGMLRTYRDLYRRTSAACLRLAQTGFNTDDKARQDIERREVATLARTLVTIDQLAFPVQPEPVVRLKKDGTPCARQKQHKPLTMVGEEGGLSGTKVTSYFYDTLKCKPFFKRGSGRRTADELAIRRLMMRYKKARPMGTLVLTFRERAKLRQEVRSSIVSDDGRLRSRYSPTTETLRLRAAKISEEEGINSQNRDRKSDLRRMFVANRGHVLVEVDQAQAEDRLASGMSGHPESLRLAKAAPGSLDRHVDAAAKIFGIDYYDLFTAYKAGDKDADEKRQTGKRTKYACWYGMGGFRMSEIALVETEGRLVLDPDECEEWIDALKANDPGVELYQAWVRRQLIEDQEQSSNWGITWPVRPLRLTKKHFKDAYARLPQHYVGVLTNQLGFVPLDEAIHLHGRFTGTEIVQQGHDSLIASCPPQQAYPVARFLHTNMSQRHTYPGAGGDWDLAMPIGVKVSHNWKEQTEWKSLPERGEFEQVLAHYVR